MAKASGFSIRRQVLFGRLGHSLFRSDAGDTFIGPSGPRAALPGRPTALESCTTTRVRTLHRHLPTKICTRLAVRSKPAAGGPSRRLRDIAPGDGYRYLQPANVVHLTLHCFDITPGVALDEPAPPAVHGDHLRLRYVLESAPPGVRLHTAQLPKSGGGLVQDRLKTVPIAGTAQGM